MSALSVAMHDGVAVVTFDLPGEPVRVDGHALPRLGVGPRPFDGRAVRQQHPEPALLVAADVDRPGPAAVRRSGLQEWKIKTWPHDRQALTSSLPRRARRSRRW